MNEYEKGLERGRDDALAERPFFDAKREHQIEREWEQAIRAEERSKFLAEREPFKYNEEDLRTAMYVAAQTRNREFLAAIEEERKRHSELADLSTGQQAEQMRYCAYVLDRLAARVGGKL